VVSGAGPRRLAVTGPWDRLHRAESEVMAGLLSVAERAAVNRRLGLPAPEAPVWIPAWAGASGGRFTEPGGPGSLYLGLDLATCVAEVAHHHARACAASIGTPAGTRAVFRHLVFQVQGEFAGACGERRAGLHDPATYAPSWGYGRRARGAGADGVHYRSVRRRGGRCLGVFRPPAAIFLRVEFGAVILEWDGRVSVRFA
jgi:hypothetical protein